MDRDTLIDYLAQAERHVAEGREHVARQRALIEELREGGHDLREAARLLANFEELLRMHLADRDRIAAEIEDSS